jgi:hypothetical protein
VANLEVASLRQVTFIRQRAKVTRRMPMPLQRELPRTGDARLARRLERTMQYPDVEASWRYPDDDARTYSTLEVWLQRDAMTLGFMTTLTAFASPGDVLLDELRLESYVPLNDTTRVACERLAASA